jgi:hypothetical protein
MNSAEPGATPTYAFRTVWHIVEADGLVGPAVGPVYLFKCFRWSRTGDVGAVAHGRTAAGEDVCARCQQALLGLQDRSGVPDATGPGPD